MLADNQRARMLAQSLPLTGWEVDLLVPDASFQIPIYLDNLSADLVPKNAAIHQVSPQCDWLFRTLKMRSIGWRALLPMYRRGVELLKRKQFDVIYISTAQFNLFCLGALWHRISGVPYILDFHDPWTREPSPHITASRGWKHHLGNTLSRHLERFALKSAAGLVSVSPVYLDQLRSRYPEYRGVQSPYTAAIPFGADECGLNLARQTALPARNRECLTTNLEIIYVGAGRSIMAKSFQRICRGLAKIKQQAPDWITKFKIRLHGTYAYWQPGDPTELQSLAQAEGVGELVVERPARIGYVDAMRLALAADGLLVLGVDDQAYMPSKLFLYAMTGKPLLACMHANSQVNVFFQQFPELGTLLHFDGPAESEVAEDMLMLDFLKQVAERKTFARENVRAEFSAAAMARKHAELFDEILEEQKMKTKAESGKQK
jgi:glycosyltransferase involved in cell wall biosynthesis